MTPLQPIAPLFILDRGASVIILEANDVIFAKILAVLNFD